jgi:hypothetical protein
VNIFRTRDTRLITIQPTTARVCISRLVGEHWKTTYSGPASRRLTAARIRAQRSRCCGAYLAQDGAETMALVNTSEPIMLLALVVRVACSLWVRAFGSPEALDEVSASWPAASRGWIWPAGVRLRPSGAGRLGDVIAVRLFPAPVDECVSGRGVRWVFPFAVRVSRARVALLEGLAVMPHVIVSVDDLRGRPLMSCARSHRTSISAGC